MRKNHKNIDRSKKECYNLEEGGNSMIVQFKVKNFLSFKEDAVLDMRAINSYKEHQCNLIKTNSKDDLVRVAAIYGANASGKSNLNLAMWYFQQIISDSLNYSSTKETAISKYYSPYGFEKVPENSEFEIVEIVDNQEFRYGFEYNSECIVAEWLYLTKLETKRQSIIFERTTDRVEFGSSIKKECEKYKEQIPQETLVLTFFNKLKTKTLVFKQVFESIKDTLVMSSDFGDDAEEIKKYLPDIIDKEKTELLRFLSAIDSGIEDVFYEVKPDGEVYLFTVHRGKDDNEYTLSLLGESEGTLKSIWIYIFARIAVLSDRSLFIDELNIKLHPLLLKMIIDLFYNTNKSKAQLIYTTHDTTLLDRKFFRRDQIWFVQKDEFGYSTISALSDFKVRSDASFEKDYLAGVYGGIPKLKDYSIEGE